MGILGRSEEVVKAQISEALVLLCSQLFQYHSEVSIEALVGVKIDKKEIFLFNCQNSTYKDEGKKQTQVTQKHVSEDEVEDDIEAIMIEPESGDENIENADDSFEEPGDKNSDKSNDNNIDDNDGNDEENDTGDYDMNDSENISENINANDESDPENNEDEEDDTQHEVDIDDTQQSDTHKQGDTETDKKVENDLKQNNGKELESATDSEKPKSQKIAYPPHRMETRRYSKRKRSESEDEASKDGVSKVEVDRDRKNSTEKSSGNDELKIKDSYSMQGRDDLSELEENPLKIVVEKEGRDDEIMFIKEEVQDSSYDQNRRPNSASRPGCTPATRQMIPITLTQPVANQFQPGQTILLQPNNQLLTTQNAPLLFPAQPNQGQKPIVFFTKNEKGELVQVKPPANMKIIIPNTTQGVQVTKTITLTKQTPVLPASLTSSPGMTVLHNLERQAEMRPVTIPAMPTLIPSPAISSQPQIRVIQVGPSTSNNAMTTPSYSNMERETDHPSMINKDGSRIKRPMNAFMIWAKQMRAKILADSGGTLQNSEVSRILGHKWKNMSRDEQQPFYDEQRRLDKLHKAHYPEYRYQPKRKRPNNVLSLSPSSAFTDADTLLLTNTPAGARTTSSYTTLDPVMHPSATVSLHPESILPPNIIATPVSDDEIQDSLLPNLTSALAASAAEDSS